MALSGYQVQGAPWGAEPSRPAPQPGVHFVHSVVVVAAAGGGAWCWFLSIRSSHRAPSCPGLVIQTQSHTAGWLLCMTAP